MISLPLNFWPILGATVLFVALLYLIHLIYGGAARKVEAWRRMKKEGLAATAAQILSADRLAARSTLALRLLRGLLMGLVAVRFVSFEMEQFKETELAGRWIVEVVLMPFKRIFDGFIDYIPNAFQLIAIVVVTRYLLTLIHKVFEQIEAGTLPIAGFYPEWAEPTYKLVRFFVFVLALVAIFPYLPGSHSPAFQTVGVFLGVLLSLGSSSIVSNMVAGTILTYMRALAVGDRVKIGETYGDVTERTLLVTRVRTMLNEVVTIPNAILLGTHITNYSTLANGRGLILRADVTIGYDAPWPRVHDALLTAARRTPQVLAEPAPFIVQTALNDYNVGYSLRVYTSEASASHLTQSALQLAILDSFAEAGIEILSPMYNTVRQSQAGDAIPAPRVSSSPEAS